MTDEFTSVILRITLPPGNICREENDNVWALSKALLMTIQLQFT